MIQIDIVSHHFERDLRRAHPRDDVLGLIDARVSPAAEVEAEPPVGLPGGRADDLGVLLHDGEGGGPGEEIEVQRAAKEAILDEGDVGRGGSEEQDVSAVRT